MSKIAAIIQARIGSKRLSGKVLEDLAGRTVLAHVIARAGAIPGIDVVCCAIPVESRSDAVAEEAQKQGAIVFRGDEQDVLGRYLGAARQVGADTIMRVTSDCPLIDPDVSAKVMKAFQTSGADYCSNLSPRSWPKGLDTEVFKTAALEEAARSTSEPYDREHVTPWLRNNARMVQANVTCDHGNYAEYRWTLDYPDDLAFFRALQAVLGNDPIPRFPAILAAVHAHPEIAALNAHLH